MGCTTGSSKQATSPGFDVSFNSTHGHGGTASFSQIVIPEQSPTDAFNFADVFGSAPSKASKLHTSPFPMANPAADPFATPTTAVGEAPLQQLPDDPFASFPSLVKPMEKSEAPKSFAVSFDDGNSGFNSVSFVDFSAADTQKSPADGLSAVNELNLDPFASPNKSQGFQETGHGDNPFGESAFS